MNFLIEQYKGVVLACWMTITITSLFSQPIIKQEKYYYPSGKLSSEGMLLNGKPNGYWKTYYENGNLKSEGNRKEFSLDSTWKFYRENGTLFQIIEYKADLKNGKEIFFDSLENISRSYMYRENVKNGESKQYYKSGKLKEEFIYENNVLNGLAKEYEELDGRLITKTVYKNGLIFSKEEINRYDKEGRRVGFWQEYYSFGELKEEGNYVAGLKQGLFKYYNRSGVFEKFLYYEMGQLVQNEEQTKFIEIKKSYDKKGRLNEIGSYRGNVKHGQFKTLDSTGNIISNKLYLNDQLISEGNYDTQGKETGNWKYFYKDGKLRSSGSYVKGKKQGEWKYFFESGEIEQRGKYENGLIEGEWLWYFDNGGLLRKENYKKNKLNGMYEEFTRDSTLVLKGEYIDDYRHDIWYIRTNNTVEEGVYYEGLKNSEWTQKNLDGTVLFSGKYEMGVPVGEHEYFYDNGKLESKGKYEGGEKNGDWKYYDEEGVFLQVITYSNNELIKVNGKKIMK